jgi:ATP-dependent Zn protease
MCDEDCSFFALLTTLRFATLSQVDVTVLPAQTESGLGDLIQSLFFPLALFAGLFYFSRNAGRGGANNPMGALKSKAE